MSPMSPMSRMRFAAFCKTKGRKRQRKRPPFAVRKTAFYKLSDYQRFIRPIRLIEPISRISPMSPMSRMRFAAFCKTKGRKRQRKRPCFTIQNTAFYKLSDYKRFIRPIRLIGPISRISPMSNISPMSKGCQTSSAYQAPFLGRVGGGAPISSACGVPILPR